MFIIQHTLLTGLSGLLVVGFQELAGVVPLSHHLIIRVLLHIMQDLGLGYRAMEWLPLLPIGSLLGSPDGSSLAPILLQFGLSHLHQLCP